jgi:hypothetical protein
LVHTLSINYFKYSILPFGNVLVIGHELQTPCQLWSMTFFSLVYQVCLHPVLKKNTLKWNTDQQTAKVFELTHLTLNKNMLSDKFRLKQPGLKLTKKAQSPCYGLCIIGQKLSRLLKVLEAHYWLRLPLTWSKVFLSKWGLTEFH